MCPKAVTAAAGNRLYAGEVESAETALALAVQAYRHEAHLTRRLMDPLDPDDDTRLADQLEALADRVQALHAELIGQQRVLFAQWAASDDPDLKWIGQSLLDGDYAALAL